ncbi:MAG TPA: hypothetical protein VLS93_01925 [Anaeromyxobacteraceae bacterium]|nr:hypothetical protein [Anaeromyxobacteraceae bacterium]
MEEGPGAPRGFLPDAVRKAIVAGVTAVFMTEEGARRLAREWKLPKELMGFIGGQASAAKEELLRIFTDEVRRFLESEAVRREFWKALSGMTVEIRAEVRLRPDGAGRAHPEVRAEVKGRRSGRRGAGT